MNLGRYKLLTRWRTAAPVAHAWQLILHSEEWPRWWAGVESVREVESGEDGLGNVRHYVWRSAFAYRLCFDIKVTRVEPLCLLEGAASGEVRGWGRWHFRSAPGMTDIVYEWDVEIVDAGLRLLSPIGRPLFKWNHHRLMQQGARGLARELGCNVSCEPVPA